MVVASMSRFSKFAPVSGSLSINVNMYGHGRHGMGPNASPALSHSCTKGPFLMLRGYASSLPRALYELLQPLFSP